MVVALLALWLVATSPWVSMLRRIPGNAGFFDYAHVTGRRRARLALRRRGVDSTAGVAWRGVGRIQAGGQYLPRQGGGLFGVIEGLLLLALLATAA